MTVRQLPPFIAQAEVRDTLEAWLTSSIVGSINQEPGEWMPADGRV